MQMVWKMETTVITEDRVENCGPKGMINIHMPSLSGDGGCMFS